MRTLSKSLDENSSFVAGECSFIILLFDLGKRTPFSDVEKSRIVHADVKSKIGQFIEKSVHNSDGFLRCWLGFPLEANQDFTLLNSF